MRNRDLRAELLKALDELLLTEGIGALTLRAVARRAGVSHAAPAVHFRNFAGMLTAYATLGFEELASAVAVASAAEHADGAAHVRAIGLAYVRFALARPGPFQVMFRRELLIADDPAFRSARDATFGPFVGAIARCAREGAFPPEEIAVRSTAAWSIAHGLADLWLGGPLRERVPGVEVEPLAEAVLEVFVGAVLRPR
ncbi:MAG TPA: TetR-like C-terminal domain-containing protein [Myxococcota bacterium]|nr:TetR-like C-terminal domain-containing protein [Myxococcota bacterium]